MAEVVNNTCRAPLSDGHARCGAPLPFSAFSCAEHTPVYNASYERYKKAGRKADRLGRSARRRHSDIQHLRSNEIEPCRTWVRAYVRALTEELRLRRKHATQLIGTPDAGHRQKVKRLEATIAHYAASDFKGGTFNMPTLVFRRRRRAGGLSRTASPVPRTVQCRRGANPEEERRASARAEARRQREEEHERQHLAVMAAERRRPQGVWAEVQGAYNTDPETPPSLSQQHPQGPQQSSEEGERSQEAMQVVDGSTSEEESSMDNTSDHLAIEECPPEDWSPREVRSDVDTSDDDTELDSASSASGPLDDMELDFTSSAPLNDVQAPLNTSQEGAPCTQVYRETTWAEDLEEGSCRCGQGGGSEGSPRGGGQGHGIWSLKSLLFVVLLLALVVLRKRHRMKSITKLWKLLKKIIHVGARRMSI
ncbi:hypothetical protein V8D89_002801 [Ganoderma adspersum]